MCVLHLGDDHDRGCPPGSEARSVGGRDCRVHGRQRLSVWHPSPHRERDPAGRACHERCGEGVPVMKDLETLATQLEPERYELSAGPAYRFQVDRRDFFKFLGGGIAVSCVLQDVGAGQESGGGRRGGEALPKDIGSWLHIGEDGVVTVYTGKVEMGQNIRTSLTQAVAEELSVAPEKICMVMGDTKLTPFDRGTFG